MKPIEKQIKKIVEKGSSEDAFLLSVSFKEARTKEIFEVISENVDQSFQAIRMIPEAYLHPCIIEKVITVARFARFVVDNFEIHRNEKIFMAAIGKDKNWAAFYLRKFNLSYTWLDELLKIDA